MNMLFVACLVLTNEYVICWVQFSYPFVTCVSIKWFEFKKKYNFTNDSFQTILIYLSSLVIIKGPPNHTSSLEKRCCITNKILNILCHLINRFTGYLDSFSHKLSWLEHCKTLPENMLCPLIQYHGISR